MELANLNDMRKRILEGNPPSREEMREGLAQLRENRMNAAASSRKASTKGPKAPPIDLGALFKDI